MEDDLSDETLAALLEQARRQIGLTKNILCRFRHAATGKRYVVVGVALREDDLTPMVVYRPVANENLRWTRPLSEFFDGRFVTEN